MTEYTPGPWIQEGRHIEAFDGKECVMGIEIYGPEEEALANGRLIAVAPDLLKAAKASYQLLKEVEVYEEFRQGKARPILTQTLNKLEEIIYRVEGGQSDNLDT